MKETISPAAGALAMALAALPTAAAAGIEIHFEGTARSEAAARQVVDEAIAFAKAHGWAVQREPAGAVLFPHTWCEPVELIFEERNLVRASVKTQYAGVQVHADVVALLRALEPRFERLKVADEGEYWPEANRSRLEARFRQEEAAIERAKASQPGSRGPIWAMGGALVDLVSGDLPPQARFDGPPSPVVTPAGWHHVTAPDAGFTVLMPAGEPARFATILDGLPYITYAHSDEKAGKRYLVLTWFWGREVDPRAAQFARQQVLANEPGTVVRERIATRRGALELEIERAGGKGRVAVLLVSSGQRAYQVQVTQDSPGPLAPEGRALLASFRPRVSEPPALASPPTPAVKVEPVESAAPSTGWRRHEARGEAFAVDLPGEPKREVFQDGNDVSWTLLAPAAAPSFAIRVFILPDAERAQKGVAMVADALTSSLPGAAARGPATVGKGLPARAVVLEDGKARAQFRVLALGRRLYRLAVIGEGRAPHPDDVRRFFDSFEQLEEQKVEPTSSKPGGP
jgi:hypothetical protein